VGIPSGLAYIIFISIGESHLIRQKHTPLVLDMGLFVFYNPIDPELIVVAIIFFFWENLSFLIHHCAHDIVYSFDNIMFLSKSRSIGFAVNTISAMDLFCALFEFVCMRLQLN
jgi:hypothetical protein